MFQVELSSVLKPARDLRFRRVDDDMVVIRQRAAEVLVLNDVAACLLELADGTTPVSGWVEDLLYRYDVDRKTLERDVLAFAAELTSEGMLEEASAPGAPP
jgi:hypothetical protein